MKHHSHLTNILHDRSASFSAWLDTRSLSCAAKIRARQGRVSGEMRRLGAEQPSLLQAKWGGSTISAGRKNEDMSRHACLGEAARTREAFTGLQVSSLRFHSGPH